MDTPILLFTLPREILRVLSKKGTGLRINMTDRPGKLTVRIGQKKVRLAEAASIEDFLQGEYVSFYDESPNQDRFATAESDFEQVIVTKNTQLRVKLALVDITTQPIYGYAHVPAERLLTTPEAWTVPQAEAAI